jgi:outer membrane protein OmpA-like peptidoglycan-associated protein
MRAMRSILLLLVSINLIAQKTPKLDTVFCDCEQARVIAINGSAKVNKTVPPNGHGQKQEISEHKQRTKFAFEKEHNSSWYKLIINTNGHLCFNIIPTKKEDDYDFMLFKGAANGFCDSLSKHRIKPIRACISRDRQDFEGKTGMSYKGKKEFENEGVGDAYVKPILVAKGEVYYLVLDNVYDKGDGHSIQFYFEEPVSIKGVILDEKNKPLVADIALTNAKGDTMELSKSKKDGSYEINTYLRAKTNYVLNFYNDSSFTYSKNVFLKDSAELKNIRTILPQLKKGVKRPIGSINFYGGSPQPIPNAIPSINNLYRLMSKNSNLNIQIEGHTNGCGFSQKEVQVLSDKRAEKIRDFLINKGIKRERIKTIGKGCKEMLFPLDDKTTLEQQEANRRVEILVLEY